MLDTNKLDEILAQKGFKPSTPSGGTADWYSQLDRNKPQPKKRTVLEKVADFTGGKELGQGLGQALALGKNSKAIEDTQNEQNQIVSSLVKRIKEKKALGQDTSKLEGALQDLGADMEKRGNNAEQILNPNQLTEKQIIGDALQVGTTILGAGALPGATKAVTGATTIGKGIVQGAKTGATTGAIFGGATGVSQGLQEDKSGKDILKQGLGGAVTGLIGGAVVGGLTGGITGGLKGRALRKQVLNNRVSEGNLPLASEKAKSIAKQQGFNDVDVDFMSTMKAPDKVKAQKMLDLAEKASKNKRAIERPIDVVGDSMTDRVKFIQNTNSTAGKAVDATAKALKGQKVDAIPVRERALSLLEEAGVTANPDGTPNWSKSIFNKTPELRNKIMKSLSDLPAGEIDAYDLHNFKKSIDEVVNYGVGGEGLKGKSASILKAVRNSADEILDSSFESYNKANTDYKITRELLDEAGDLFGKKSGLSKERGGQLLRSVFSNNTQRPRVLSLIEKLDAVSKQYGGKFDDNLVDQALFTEILEDIYGTQATTSLQGQVERAVKGTKRVIEGIRDPLKGLGDLAATGVEKSIGITDENKRKILQALIK